MKISSWNFLGPGFSWNGKVVDCLEEKVEIGNHRRLSLLV